MLLELFQELIDFLDMRLARILGLNKNLIKVHYHKNV